MDYPDPEPGYYLEELDASFLQIIDARTFQRTDKLDGAQGVIFLCPKCFHANGGEIGTHAVICWSSSRGTPPDQHPLPGRWKMDGDGLHDLTLNGETGGARSILLTAGCGWHGFVTDGYATLG